MASNCIPLSNKNEEEHETIKLNDDLISKKQEKEQNIQTNEEYDNKLHVGILKYRREEQERKLNENISATLRKQLSFVVSLFYLPSIILNIHYIENDDSCLHNNPFVNINLHTFLLVDTIGSILTLSIVVLFILYNIKNNILQHLYNIYLYCYFIYLFIWLIVGSVVFWVFTNKHNCDKGIYTYIYVLIVLKCVFQIFNILRCVNIYKNNKETGNQENNQDDTTTEYKDVVHNNTN